MKRAILTGTHIRTSKNEVTVMLKGKFANNFLLMHRVTETWACKPVPGWGTKDYVHAAIAKSHANHMTDWHEQFFITAY